MTMYLYHCKHPEFSMALEIACTIPPYPQAVPLADLVEDFGCFNQDRILAHLDDCFGPNRCEIMPMSYKGHKRWICVAQFAWPQIKEMCEKYWRQLSPYFA